MYCTVVNNQYYLYCSSTATVGNVRGFARGFEIWGARNSVGYEACPNVYATVCETTLGGAWSRGGERAEPSNGEL
jgi:hypothetical protein